MAHLLESIDHYPDHLRLIGLVITEMARAEGTLAVTFWALIGDPVRADSVFWTLGNAKARVDIVRGAAMQTLTGSYTKDTLRSDLLKALEAFRDAASKRNDIAHGQWGTPAGSGPDPFVSIKKPATKNPEVQRIYTTDDLQEVVEQIRVVEKQIGKLTRAIEYFAATDDDRFIWAREAGDRERAASAAADAFLRRYEEPPSLDHRQTPEDPSAQ